MFHHQRIRLCYISNQGRTCRCGRSLSHLRTWAKCRVVHGFQMQTQGLKLGLEKMLCSWNVIVRRYVRAMKNLTNKQNQLKLRAALLDPQVLHLLMPITPHICSCDPDLGCIWQIHGKYLYIFFFSSSKWEIFCSFYLHSNHFVFGSLGVHK